jgi:hypothetical protein
MGMTRFCEYCNEEHDIRQHAPEPPPYTTKGEAAQAAGLKVYDTALPQDWLDDVVNRLAPFGPQPARTQIYETIRIGTVWCYDTARVFGAPVALTDEANRLLSLLD